MIRRLLRWWPPHLRTEIALLRASVRQTNAAYAKCRDAYNREVSAHMETRNLLDQERVWTRAAGFVRPILPPFTRQQTEAIADHAHDKRTDDGIGDLA